MSKFRLYAQLISNMGWKYIAFRTVYELKRKTGVLKRKFPIAPPVQTHLELAEWRKNAKPFLFQSRKDILLEKTRIEELKINAQRIMNGEIQFFSSDWLNLGTDYDWITNPDSGFQYDISKHWTEVNDYSKKAGDIKYVWEKSRFSYLYSIIRYDYHFNEDNSLFVFQEISNWMDANPINMGPNYKCSQEISLRVLNWIFALYFYRNSAHLTDKLFNKLIHFINWQLHHIYNNINFSRIAVRNNHAITETLALYIIPTIFPDLPNAEKCKLKGKKWFEQEIDYQIYNDGTFLQFSMNYHRVVIQLLTWAIQISDLNKDYFKTTVYDKAYSSLNFLYQCQEETNGFLPNYGSNDGALFFKLSSNDYRDYRPQLDALHVLLTNKSLYKEHFEDTPWYGSSAIERAYKPLSKKYGSICFDDGGYYLIREEDTLTFIRCGKYKDRPAHADNLHIDIWYKGQNILLDGGTYKYNTSEDNLNYFMGTSSHNTVIIEHHNQMLKGNRFIWYYWSQALAATIKETDKFYEFTGRISCFRQLSKSIMHQRIVRKYKSENRWHIEDSIYNLPNKLTMSQLWHLPKEHTVSITSLEDHKTSITEAYYSSYYGHRIPISQIEIESVSNTINSIIKIT